MLPPLHEQGQAHGSSASQDLTSSIRTSVQFRVKLGDFLVSLPCCGDDAYRLSVISYGSPGCLEVGQDLCCTCSIQLCLTGLVGGGSEAPNT